MLTMPAHLNLQPCPKCGKVMNAQQRRFPCPVHIPAPEEAVRELARARRNDVFSLVSQAIAQRGLTGPGTWSASPHVRFGVSIEWTGTGPDVDLNEDSQKPGSNLAETNWSVRQATRQTFPLWKACT